VPGPQGATGQTGMQGPQGLQGLPGKDCDCTGITDQYINMYSYVDQSLTANGAGNDTVKFQLTNVVSPGGFDTTNAALLGEIKVLHAGTYVIQYHVDGLLTPPYPAPVPSWGVALYKNGILIPGSPIAGFSQSPDDDAICLSNSVQFVLAANDIITLRNITTFPIFLKAVQPEFVTPLASANINLLKIK
jgi:hypothetical protein